MCVYKDDPPAMDFVTAAANLRMHIFSMNMKSRFDVKCKSRTKATKQSCQSFYSQISTKNLNVFVNFSSAMAGNIIPAIATTNAVIAGLIVLEGLKILSGELESCRTVSLLLSFFSSGSYMTLDTCVRTAFGFRCQI